MKYIVKNCPAFCDYTRQCRGAYNREIEYQYCSGNGEENCLLKQIVELCKKQKKWESEKMESGQTIEIYNGAYDFAQEILNLLEIEEVNE